MRFLAMHPTKFVLSRDDVLTELGTPKRKFPASTMAMLDRKGQGPRWFKLGRRDFVLFEDFTAWLINLRNDGGKA
jgi:hypothetical protein